MKLEDYKDKHKGESILVLGCGPSAYQKAEDVRHYTTIAVNDAADLCGLKKVDYNLICDPPIKLLGRNTGTPCNAFFYRKDNFDDILSIEALGITEAYVAYETVPIGMGAVMDEHPLRHSIMSPFIAATLAAYMGASCIGILGVDLILDGTAHKMCLPRHVERSNYDWEILRRSLKPTTLVNCSSKSKLEALYTPKEGITFLSKRRSNES